MSVSPARKGPGADAQARTPRQRRLLGLGWLAWALSYGAAAQGLVESPVDAALSAATPTAAEPAAAAIAAPSAPPTDFRLGALGLSVSRRPEFAGAARSAWSLTPNLVLQWGRVTLSNGGTLASRAGEPAEAGLTADLFSRDRLSLRAAVNFEQGRNSQEIERLRGVHDIPAHLRGRVQAAWRLHPQWELMGVWRGDLTDRGTGSSAEVVLLHEWRPDFLDHRRWRISGGVAAQWRDARQANLFHGVTAEDAMRSAFPAYRMNAGFTDARLFANWRRELDGPWVAYGAFGYESLMREAARSPIVQRPRAFTFSLGAGRRF